MNEFERARLRKQNDNLKVSPIELLKMVIDDIERGECQCDGLLVLTTNRPAGESWNYDAYRCGLSRDQELVTVVMAQERVIRNWREGA